MWAKDLEAAFYGDRVVISIYFLKNTQAFFTVNKFYFQNVYWVQIFCLSACIWYVSVCQIKFT